MWLLTWLTFVFCFSHLCYFFFSSSTFFWISWIFLWFHFSPLLIYEPITLCCLILVVTLGFMGYIFTLSHSTLRWYCTTSCIVWKQYTVWSLNNTNLNCTGPLIGGVFSINTCYSNTWPIIGLICGCGTVDMEDPCGYRYSWIFDWVGVSAPNPCIVQGSTLLLNAYIHSIYHFWSSFLCVDCFSILCHFHSAWRTTFNLSYSTGLLVVYSFSFFKICK